jgi:hypothetical protein
VICFLAAASMKMAVYWVVTPSSPAQVYRRFRVPAAIIIALMMQAASSSETSVNHQPIRRYFPLDILILASSNPAMLMLVFWVMTSCLVGGFVGRSRLYCQGELKTKAIRSSETSVTIYKATQRHTQKKTVDIKYYIRILCCIILL